MPQNRQSAEKTLYELINKLMPGSDNVNIYKNIFSRMNDAQFDDFMMKLKDGKIKLAVIAPIMNKNSLDVKRNLDLAKELGHQFFERVWMDERDGIPSYLTPKKYLIVDLPLRRQAQILIKKISIPEDNRSVDHLTGQPTGASKGSKISYPEVQILAALGLDESIVELTKYRGGDIKGFNAMNDSISRTGGVSITSLDRLGTKVRATQVLATYLTCMHLENTLLA